MDNTRQSGDGCAGQGQLDVEFRVSVRLQVLTRLKTASDGGVEDLALSLVALRDSGTDPTALLRAQHRSGGWCPLTGAGEPGVFHTALALLALRPFQNQPVQGAVDRAFRWLSEVGGLESHWLWQWKFRLFDRQVRFDPSKSGWPWVPGTVSWVAPTALAILAFRAWHRESPRVLVAGDMLLDRACPRGGWNAGNSVVFGVDLDPHPDFTAMALLALCSSAHSQHALVRRSLDYLHDRLTRTLSPYSLAWAVLALSAHGHAGTDHLRNQLERGTAARVAALPARTLALAALALEQPSFSFEGMVR
jgi:hypothetical protein